MENVGSKKNELKWIETHPKTVSTEHQERATSINIPCRPTNTFTTPTTVTMEPQPLKPEEEKVIVVFPSKKKKQVIRPANYKPETKVKEEVEYATVSKINQRKDNVRIYDPLDD